MNDTCLSIRLSLVENGIGETRKAARNMTIVLLPLRLAVIPLQWQMPLILIMQLVMYWQNSDPEIKRVLSSNRNEQCFFKKCVFKV